MPEISEDWKKIKLGTEIDFEFGEVTLKAFVAAIDPAVGITLEYVNEEAARRAGSHPRADGVCRPLCVNKEEQIREGDSETEYNEIFNMYSQAILAGRLPKEVGDDGIGVLSVCAFS